MSDDTTTLATPVTPDHTAEGTGGARRARTGLAARAGEGTWIWAGLALVVAGFGTIFFAWVNVAETVDVGRQMPYVVSGAITGLALVVVGMAVVDMAVRRQDRLERRQQLTLMRSVLEELRDGNDADGTLGRR